VIDPDAFDINFVAVPAHDAFTEELDGEAVVYHETSETVHLLSPTATIVWRCLDGEASLATISSELATAFGAELTRINEDVLGVVRDFGRQGLLEGVQPDADVVAAHFLGKPEAKDGI
jgi:hypothetical protein